MENIDHALLNYDDLTAAERAVVDGYLAEHPEAAAMLAEGRALRALLDEATQAGTAVPDAEALALYLAARSASARPLPADLEALGTRIEDAFEEHPELERHYAMMQDRLKRLTAAAEAPLAQFERLTGRRLRQANAPVESPAKAKTVGAQRGRRSAWRASAADREAVPILRRLSVPRLAFAAVLAVALAYGGLFVASQSGTTRWERLAGLEAMPAEFEGLRLRGTSGQTDPVTERYAEALQALSAARATTLGLFPSYDPDGLARATTLLEEAASLGEPDGPIVLEARFLTGKIRLYEGDLDAAREAFQAVADRHGPSAPDARRLLDELAAERP